MIGGEKASVQNPIIKYAVDNGWEYITPDECLRMRQGETGIILREIFEAQMMKLNPDFMDGNIINDLIKKIENIRPTVEGNREMWEYLKGLKTVFIPYQNRDRNLKLIDFDNVDRNKFNVTDEFSFRNDRFSTHPDRPDIVFFINGIPIFIVETKSSQLLNAIPIAMEQILRYHKEIPELMVVLQSFQITDIIKFFYGPTFNVSDNTLIEWKRNDRNFEELVKAFFDKSMVLKIIKDYILFIEADNEIKKVILKTHQIRAIDKIIDRIESKDKSRGLIWHTQGSGKTFTMIVSARKIILDPIFDNPTIIMVVDRNELEQQMFENLKKVGFENIVVANSIDQLRKLLIEDYRGVIVTLIHKFREMMPEISKRENIYVFVDEAHRSVGGKFGNFMMGALPNAKYIGFTGTPVASTHGPNTFMIFGRDDPNGYLDKYGIIESINDNTTLPLTYKIAPNHLLVKKEILDKEFLELSELYGVSDIDELNEVLRKQVTLRNEMKNPQRMDEIAKSVAEHFKNNVEPLGYKAFLVAVDRESCVIYKKLLDKYLPKDYSEVIISPYYNDDEEMKKYYHSEEEERELRKRFKDPSKTPKIFIVTDKLLTGYDAPILYAMYLDKPMRDHVLLQAIARINRPYESQGMKKQYGLIIDFVGIFGYLKKALLFDARNLDDIMFAIQNIELLKERFKNLIEEMKKDYLEPLKGLERDKIVDEVISMLKASEQKRNDFYKKYNELKDLYEILSPDEFLRPYLTDFKDLTSINLILQKLFGNKNLPYLEFSRKTADLVKNNTIPENIPVITKTYELNAETLKKIMEKKGNTNEKVFNLMITIRDYIEKSLNESPFLISIGERAEKIAREFTSNQINSEATLEELKKLVQEILEEKEEQSKKGYSKETFAFYYFIKQKDLKDPEDLANKFMQLTNKYPKWFSNPTQEREIKRFLIKELMAKNYSAKDSTVIIKEIIENLKKGIKNGQR
ncbi:MAG: type I restriction endonuclease subunit R [Caldisericum sp.]|uniref:type I restriction endonuclease subunit R n=1 Tax=Caldisericum sp. TaxID=2499687 RepID=UPI003D11001B